MKSSVTVLLFLIASLGFSQQTVEMKEFKSPLKKNLKLVHQEVPKKTFDITYGFKITVPENYFNLFSMTIPLPADVYGQKLESFTVSHPYTVEKVDSHSLTYLRLDLKDAFKKSKQIDVVIHAKVTKEEKQVDLKILEHATVSPNAYKNYLASDNIINLNNSQLAKDVAPMRGKSIQEKVEYAYDLVKKRMKYYAVGKGLKPLDTILTDFVGECGDFSTYFIALLRKMGIPARHVVGKIIDKQNVYHAWAEFYVDNIWIPVDVTNPTFQGKKVYGFEPSEYMPFHYGINMNVDFGGGRTYVLGILQAYSFIYLTRNNGKADIQFEPIWSVK